MTKNYFQIPNFLVVLKYLGDGYNNLTDIHHKTRITYSHLVNLKKEFIKRRWVVEEGNGREKLILLTEKGIQITNTLPELFENLGIDDENIITYRRTSKKTIV